MSQHGHAHSVRSLLYRFNDPSSGEILMDGVALPQLDVASWRARLSIMTQDVLLFNATVKENIAYGRPSADEKAIRSAASVAAAHDFIEALPDIDAATVRSNRSCASTATPASR